MQRPARSPTTIASSATLSVVIPVRCRAWQADRVLQALLPLDPLEILVCDSSALPTALPTHPLFASYICHSAPSPVQHAMPRLATGTG
ncbi:MAG: hypothetical protein R3E67_09500 [Pseudomonadales bacterium]